MPFTPPVYTPFTWQDFEAGGTALSAAELMTFQAALSGGFQAGDSAVAAYADGLVAGLATAAALAAETSARTAADALLAPSASPNLTGTPTAPTPTAGDNTTKLSTTAYADRAVSTEATRATTAEGLLAPKTNAVLTTATAAATPAANDNSLKLSTTAYADRAATTAASGVAVPAASTTTPAADGTAFVGTGATWARADHVHPTDTTRAPLAKRITTIASSATPAVNVAATDVVTITALTVPITSMTSGLTGSATPEQPIMWRIHATAALAIAWGASFISDGVTPLPLITVANKTIRVGTIWDEVAAKHVCVAASVVGY